MTPNVPNPRSRGRLYLTSADPAIKPALDFRYFVCVYLNQPSSYDGSPVARPIQRTTMLNVSSMDSKLPVRSRRLRHSAIGSSVPSSSLHPHISFARLKQEVAPGPHITSDEDLNNYGRKAAHTVYHPVRLSMQPLLCSSHAIPAVPIRLALAKWVQSTI